VKKHGFKVAGAGLIAGLGLLFMGVSPASADTGPQQAQSSASGDGVLSGNSLALNVAIPVQVECNLTGIGIFGGGGGISSCHGPAAKTGPQQAASSAEGDGVASGNSAAANIAAPITVRCNGTGGGGAGIGIGLSSCG